ncbi:hypothetical protein [Nocardia nepalensis]|uniref:hypothetical protein n=1 Tax=Nocardia nepalensis TaxID=3375448 RepID=UPI003B66B986
MDRELAEQLLAAEEELPDSDDTAEDSTGPGPEGYTIDSYLLLSIIDALQGVQAAVIASVGAEPPRITPMVRPTSALELLREEARTRSMQQLIDQFRPATD